MAIHTLETIHDTPGRAHAPAGDMGLYVLQLRSVNSRAAREIPPPNPAEPVDEYPVDAEVSTWNPEGDEWVPRWVGVCRIPIDAGKDDAGEPRTVDCGGALVVSHVDPRFYCIRCHNVATGRRWRRVIFPAERELGETVLEARHPANRIWEPGETVADLIAQNDRADDPVPEAARLAVGLGS